MVLHGSRLTGGYALFRTGDDSWMIHRERRLPLPDRIVPMLARIGDLPADDGAWAYEMKWDGLRALAYIGGGRVRLLSRTGQDITRDYPELGGLGAAVGRRQAVLDGEIVALGEDSWPNFERLQQRMNARKPGLAQRLAPVVPVTYLAFDLLHLDGRPLLDEPYRARRALLEELDLQGPRWQTPPSFTGEAGADVQAVSRQHGLEGIVAKRLASRYEPGKRTGSWRKIKNLQRQEVVVGGWKPGEGSAGLPVRFPAHRRTGRRWPGVCGPCRHRVQPAGPGHAVAAADAAAPGHVTVRQSRPARARPPRGLGGAGAGDRCGLHRVDRGRTDAGALIPGAARGQGPGGGHPGAVPAGLVLVGRPDQPGTPNRISFPSQECISRWAE